MRIQFGLKLREEIHAGHYLSKAGSLRRIPKEGRMAIIRYLTKELGRMTHLRLITVIVDKRNKDAKYDVFDNAWRALIQRFENTLDHRNFPGGFKANEVGVVVPDATDVKRLTQLSRRLRRFNPIPHQPQFGMGYRDLTMQHVTEDPVFRDSVDSYFIQAADTCAFWAYQRESPNRYIRKKGLARHYERLRPIFLRVASPNDPDGIVRL